MFSDEEVEQIQRNMSKANTENFSLYARKMLLDGLVIHRDFQEIKNLLKALNRFGDNLEKIVTIAEKNKNVTRSDLRVLMHSYEKCIEEVNNELLRRIQDLNQEY
jgi:predicted Zn-dependent peptidase